MSYQAHPLRIQLSRKKGFRKPEGSVVVTRASKWGNPFSVGDTFWASITKRMSHGQFDSPAAAVGMFRWWLEYADDGRELLAQIHELRGKQLGCFCKLDKPCHADVLAALAANPGGPGR